MWYQWSISGTTDSYLLPLISIRYHWSLSLIPMISTWYQRCPSDTSKFNLIPVISIWYHWCSSRTSDPSVVPPWSLSVSGRRSLSDSRDPCLQLLILSVPTSPYMILVITGWSQRSLSHASYSDPLWCHWSLSHAQRSLYEILSHDPLTVTQKSGA